MGRACCLCRAWDKQHYRTCLNKALKVTRLPPGRALARVAMEDYLGRVLKFERDLNELREARARSGGVARRSG